MSVLRSRCASYRLSILLSLALLVSDANCGEDERCASTTQANRQPCCSTDSTALSS